MNISSSIFENNIAVNGGAIYIGEKLDNKLNHTISIYDTKFINNQALHFGGAIYSEFDDIKLLIEKNLQFIENHAYAGGAIYINNNNNKAINKSNTDINTNTTIITSNNKIITRNFNENFNISNYSYFAEENNNINSIINSENAYDIINVLRNNNNIIYSNNTSESHGENYASGPYLINQSFDYGNHSRFGSGESFPLSFNLVDIFDNEIVDVSKYFQSIELDLDIEYNNTDIVSRVSGNRCFFDKGRILNDINMIKIIIIIYYII